MGGPRRTGNLKEPDGEYYTEAEQQACIAIIATLYRQPELEDKTNDLTEGDFYCPTLRATYGCIKASISRNEAPNLLTYAGQVGCSVTLLRGVCERNIRAAELAGNVALVADASARRSIQRTLSSAREIVDSGADSGGLQPELALEEIIDSLVKLRKQGGSQERSSLEVLEAEIWKIADLKRRKDAGEVVRLGVPTGLTTLDSYIGGLTRGLITVGGAITKMGKSSFSLQTVLGAAQYGEYALYFPLEDRTENTMHRLIARETGITAQELRSLRFETRGLEQIQRAKQVLAPLLHYIKFDDTAGLTAKEMCRRIRKHAAFLKSQGKFLGLVVVDYIQLVRPAFPGDEVQSILDSMRELQAVTKEVDCATLVISQLNDRTLTKRGEEILTRTQEYYGYKPEFSDFKWSSAIEEMSKLVLLFHRPAFFDKSLDDNEFQIIIALSNFGESGGKVLPYVWEGKLTKILNQVHKKAKPS